MMFTNKVYDVLVWITQILLPAIGTLYFALAGIWNFPYADQIVGTITAVVFFLGTLLGISRKSYRKGTFDETVEEEIEEAEPEE